MASSVSTCGLLGFFSGTADHCIPKENFHNRAAIAANPPHSPLFQRVFQVTFGPKAKSSLIKQQKGANISKGVMCAGQGAQCNILSCKLGWLCSEMATSRLFVVLKKLVKHEFSWREMLMRRILQEKNGG